jgi:hypothetical protein
MRQSWPPQPQIGFQDLFARGKSPKVSALEADSFQGIDDSIIFYKIVNQYSIFSKILAYLPFKNQILHSDGA